ncbi:ABC transporter permease [Euzebya rosea]|uniref:ABC transporter permease n=1 Tax=Euzebya rosea TaxID=2052804 RepID=UPI000D3E7E6E|nr:ABC transporter permease [Euzebya rosea]
MTATASTGPQKGPSLGLLGWRYLAEYARRPLNLVLLVVVPVVFVTLSAGAIADFADALGGITDLGPIEAATAGWAASLLAGVAGFFHVTGSREADRRLAAAGAGTLRVVAARLTSALGLAALAGIGALGALTVRTDLADAPRVVGVTLLMAVTYLGIGAIVGALVRSELNGSLVVVFVWLFDVFFGPAFGGSGVVLRTFPLHFPTLVVTDVASGHAGPLGGVGLSALWAVGALLAGTAALVRTTRPSPLALPRPAGRWRRIAVALRYGFRDYRRNLVLWVLLVGLPVAFITLSIAVTPNDPTPVELIDGGTRSLQVLPMSDLHGAIMVPITAGFLAGLAGLFVALGSAEGVRRLVLAGYRPLEILAARLGVIVFAALLTTGVSLAVTGASFTPVDWWVFGLANVLVALTYGMLGVLIGPRFGLLGGLYLMLALPFIDVGIAQNAMFDAAPPAWAVYMPAHGGIRVMLDGAFTASFDELAAFGLALTWLAGVTVLAVAQFRHLASPRAG